MKIMVSITGRWGRYPLFLAKVGTMPGSLVMIKRARSFEAGQIIQFSEERENSGRCKSCTPRWHGGRISKVGDDRLFIDRW